MVNFVKEGRVGDKVKHPVYGDGVIYKINHSCYHSIRVNFDNTITATFTSDGRERNIENPSLCFANGSFCIDQGTPPEREPKPLEFDGNPVWAWVGSKKSHIKYKQKRLVIAHAGTFLFIYNGRDNTESIITMHCKYAWEIPEGEE